MDNEVELLDISRVVEWLRKTDLMYASQYVNDTRYSLLYNVGNKIWKICVFDWRVSLKVQERFTSNNLSVAVAKYNNMLLEARKE